MAKWHVTVKFTGYADMEIEADSYDEAYDEAIAIADENMVHGWDYDIEYCDSDDG